MSEAINAIKYGDPGADIVLIQPACDHDLSGLEKEYEYIRRAASTDFQLIAVEIDDWNRELSPWKAPAVFGRNGFGDGAEETLRKLMPLTEDRSKTYYIGGYSLAGLFALWTAYHTDVFAGVGAASPSVWFPGFVDYMKAGEIRTDKVYLSLGDKEERTKNPAMATVGNCIKECYGWLRTNNICCTLEWNEGNHFKDSELRTAKAFAWLIASAGNI
jgi:hypothetical protein